MKPCGLLQAWISGYEVLWTLSDLQTWINWFLVLRTLTDLLGESVVQSKSTRSQKPKLSTVKQVTKWMGDHYVLGFAGRRPEISQESKSVQILQKSFG